jgi:ABC-type bacteriocin/lantibiotic exporter with double-glycine peptidase domain
LIHVPNVQQSPAMCGPASLRAALLAFGVDRTEADLAALAGATYERGTTPGGLLRAAQACGVAATLHQAATYEQLRGWLGEGAVPIVNWFASTDGHHSVVVHVGPKRIALMDPDRAARRWLSRATFETVWFDYDLIDGSPTFWWHCAVVLHKPS